MPQFYPKQSMQLGNSPRGVINSPRENLYQIISRLGLSANLALCLDAGAFGSWSGSGQLWNDLSVNANNFMFGSNTSVQATLDPTFTGVAGAMTANSYFTAANTAYFRYSPGTNATWMRDFHKTNNRTTIMFVGTVVNGTDDAVVVTTRPDVSNSGLEFRLSTSLDRWFQWSNNTGYSNTTYALSYPNTSFVVMSANIVNGGSCRTFINGTDYPFTWGTSLTTANAAGVMSILNHSDGVMTTAGNNLRLNMLAIWNNRDLTAAQANSIYNALKAVRFNGVI